MFEEKIKKEINKCSRCALCLQNCPVFEITKNENNTSRGLICKLNGFEKGELKEDEIKKDFKICLMCEKCKKNCPSKIDTTGIFAYKNAYLNKSKFNQKFVLFLKLLPIKILYFLNFFKIKNKNPESKTLYFKGCLVKSQHKTTYLDKLFYDPDFSCCGLPYLTSGDFESYKKAKKRNTDLIKSANSVVFDCASCKSCVENYDTLTIEDKKKLKFFTDFKEYKLKNNSKYKNKIITFHKPCHLSDEDFSKIELILSNLEINYKKLDDKEACCGFGGSYFLFHPLIALKIASKKIKSIKKTKADLVLTSCPSCTLGLRVSQLIFFNFKKTLELRDFLDKETEIL